MKHYRGHVMIGQLGYVRIARRKSKDYVELSGPVACEVVYQSDYSGDQITVKLLEYGGDGYEQGTSYRCHKNEFIPR